MAYAHCFRHADAARCTSRETQLAELADICRALAAGDIEQELREPSLGGHIILEASAKGGVAEHIGQALAERLSRARVV